MADIHDCIQRAVGAGELQGTRARAALSEYDQLVTRFESYLPRHQAEREAKLALKEATKVATASRRHKAIAQIQTAVRIRELINNAPDPAVALRNLIEFSEGSGFTGESVRSMQNAMVQSINAGLRDFLKATHQTLTKFSRDPALLRQIIEELHGQKTGNLNARALADSVRFQQERLRKMFNAHGGNIGKLTDFGVSHTHNVVKLRKAGFDEWARTIHQQLDWSRIVDFQTGKPFAAKGATPAMNRVDVFLQGIYDNITTRGWSKRDPSMTPGGKALYSSRADHRVLHFKDGTNWMDYNEKFGQSDPFTSIVGGLHGIGKDIALMRVLGPNPTMGLELATQFAERRAALSKNPTTEDQVRAASRLASTMLFHADGSANVPVSEAWASFLGGNRAVLTSVQLGSAPLSSVTDLRTITMAAKHIGMSQTGVIQRATALMSSAEAREMAGRGGYVFESLAKMGAAASRYTGDTFAPEIAHRLVGITMRASGLEFWTDALRTAFQMEFAGFMASQAAKDFAALPDQLRNLFQSRGIKPADWDALRNPSARFAPKPDADFITPFHWLEHTDMPRAEAEGLAMRVQMMIDEQLEYAVPTMSLEGRARVLGKTQPGTIEGELLRSTFMYKGFTASFTINQIRRFNALPTPMDKAKYAATMGAGLIALGAVSVQLKEVAKGRDPRPMTDGKFWMAAVFQSGGLGIFGDFFSSETSRSGGGLAETLAGPVVGFASDLLKPIASNVTRLLTGQDTSLAADAANMVRYNTPVASSLWYARLAYDRMVADQLQRLIDPEAESRWARQEKQRQRDYGTSTWWDRGDMTPTRAPDLSNIAGARQ